LRIRQIMCDSDVLAGRTDPRMIRLPPVIPAQWVDCPGILSDTDGC
jgi:hypothetical protein